MKMIMTQNGTTALYLAPDTEIEKLMLQSLFSGAVDSKQHPTIQVGTKNLVDCIEITSVVQAVPVKTVES